MERRGAADTAAKDEERDEAKSGEGREREAVVWVPGSDGACGSRNRSVEPVLGRVSRRICTLDRR